MMDVKEPELKDIEKYLIENGKKGSLTITRLGKLNPFIQAMNSEIGREILKDDIDRHETLLEKIYNENATPQEMAEFRYLKIRLVKISDRFSTYMKCVQEVVKK